MIRNVLIVGGGIGGLTAAVALARAGVSAEIVEIKREWTVYGVGIIQPNNALRALDQIGLAEHCVARGAGYSGWHICDANGNVLVEVPNSNAAAPAYPPINGISRIELHKILSQAAHDSGTPVRLGVTVETLRQHLDHVEVAFTDGSTGRYDLVIGADGVHSRLRAMVFGNGADMTVRRSGQSVWRYNFARPREVTWGKLFYGRKTKAGLVPMSPSTMYMLLVTPSRGDLRGAEDRLHLLMREQLQEYGGIIAELAKSIDDPRGVVYRMMEHLVVAPPWHRGRVLLIGDAAHATTPHLAQGASMAVEDAVLLGELAARKIAIDALLAEFMARRYDRCRLAVDASLKLGEWEMLEWEGRLGPDADPAGLLATTQQRLLEPY